MGLRAKKIYHSFLILLSVILLVGIISFAKNNPLIFHKLNQLHLGYFLLLVIFQIAGLAILGLTHQLPLMKHKIEIKPQEWFGLSVVSEMFNMILPANGGTGVRMMYLKDKKNLPIRQFLAMNFAMIVTGFSMLGIVGTLYFQYVFTRNDTVFRLLESVFIALAFSGILLLIFSEIFGKIFKFKKKYSPKIYLFDSRLTFTVTLYWLVFFALYPIKIYLSFLAIGVQVGLTESFEISLILLASYFFQVLPGNVGVREIITAYVSTHYGISFETALLASLIDRGTLLIFVMPVGIYFYWKLLLNSITPDFLGSWIKRFRPIRSEQTSP